MKLPRGVQRGYPYRPGAHGRIRRVGRGPAQLNPRHAG
jgi:hypothetical protein